MKVKLKTVRKGKVACVEVYFGTKIVGTIIPGEGEEGASVRIRSADGHFLEGLVIGGDKKVSYVFFPKQQKP